MQIITLYYLALFEETILLQHPPLKHPCLAECIQLHEITAKWLQSKKCIFSSPNLNYCKKIPNIPLTLNIVFGDIDLKKTRKSHICLAG